MVENTGGDPIASVYLSAGIRPLHAIHSAYFSCCLDISSPFLLYNALRRRDLTPSHATMRSVSAVEPSANLSRA